MKGEEGLSRWDRALSSRGYHQCGGVIISVMGISTGRGEIRLRVGRLMESLRVGRLMESQRVGRLMESLRWSRSHKGMHRHDSHDGGEL